MNSGVGETMRPTLRRRPRQGNEPGHPRVCGRTIVAALVGAVYLRSSPRVRANRDSPLFDEIRGIVRKTVGVEESIRDALEPLAGSLVLALLYGSIARRMDTAASDVDLLLVSDELTLETVYAALAPVETLLGRHVSPTIYTSGEFQSRRAAKAGFLTRVLGSRHIVLMGSLDGVCWIKRIASGTSPSTKAPSTSMRIWSGR